MAPSTWRRPLLLARKAKASFRYKVWYAVKLAEDKKTVKWSVASKVNCRLSFPAQRGQGFGNPSAFIWPEEGDVGYDPSRSLFQFDSRGSKNASSSISDRRCRRNANSAYLRRDSSSLGCLFYITAKKRVSVRGHHIPPRGAGTFSAFSRPMIAR